MSKGRNKDQEVMDALLAGLMQAEQDGKPLDPQTLQPLSSTPKPESQKP